MSDGQETTRHATGYCPNCGAARSGGAFCSDCGAKLDKESSTITGAGAHRGLLPPNTAPTVSSTSRPARPKSTPVWPSTQQWVTFVAWSGGLTLALVVLSFLPQDSLTTPLDGKTTASTWETGNKVWWVFALFTFLCFSLAAGFLAATRRGPWHWAALAGAVTGPAIFLLHQANAISDRARSAEDLDDSMLALGVGVSGMSWSMEIGYWLLWVVLLVGAVGVGALVLSRLIRPRA